MKRPLDRPRTIGRVAVVVGFLVVMGLIFLSPARDALTPSQFIETLTAARDSVRALWYAPIAFVAGMVLGSICFVPVTLFILAGAFFWGWLEGGIYSLVGAIISAAVSFELSRYVFGDFARRIFQRRLSWLHRVFDEAGVRSVMILRLVPGIPFPLFNFGAGLTSLRSRDYLIGSSVGLSVPVFIITFSADAILAGTLSRGELGWRIAVAALLLAFLVVGVPFLVRRLRPGDLPPEPVVEENGGSVVN